MIRIACVGMVIALSLAAQAKPFQEPEAVQPISVYVAQAGAPTAGTYTCHKISSGRLIMLGDLEIKGNTYRGLVAEGPFHKFGNSGGDLTLSQGLVGMPDGWVIDSVKNVPTDPEGRPYIRIYYHSASGNHEVIDCVQE